MLLRRSLADACVDEAPGPKEASDANGLGASAACWYSPIPAGASSAAGDRRLSYALLFSLNRGEAYDAWGAAEAAAWGLLLETAAVAAAGGCCWGCC